MQSTGVPTDLGPSVRLAEIVPATATMGPKAARMATILASQSGMGNQFTVGKEATQAGRR